MNLRRDFIATASRALFTKQKLEAEGRPVPAALTRQLAELENHAHLRVPREHHGQLEYHLRDAVGKMYQAERAANTEKVRSHYQNETLRMGVANPTMKPVGKDKWDGESLSKLARGEQQVEFEESVGRDGRDHVTRRVAGESSDVDEIRAAVTLATLKSELDAGGMSEERAELIDSGLQDHRDASGDLPRNEQLDPRNDVVRAILSHGGVNHG